MRKVNIYKLKCPAGRTISEDRDERVQGGERLAEPEDYDAERSKKDRKRKWDRTKTK